PVRRSECRPLSVGGRGCRSLSLHDALPILLLAGLGSGASLETSGETTRLPIAVDRSMRSIVADPPAARFRRRADGAARFPRKQRTLSVRTQTPWLAVTETNVAPAGIAIATNVSSARSGPLFVP